MFFEGLHDEMIAVEPVVHDEMWLKPSAKSWSKAAVNDCLITLWQAMNAAVSYPQVSQQQGCLSR